MGQLAREVADIARTRRAWASIPAPLLDVLRELSEVCLDTAAKAADVVESHTTIGVAELTGGDDNVNRLRQMLYQQLLSNSGCDRRRRGDRPHVGRTLLRTFCGACKNDRASWCATRGGGTKRLRQYGDRGLGGNRVTQLRRSGTWPVVVNSSAAGRFTCSPISWCTMKGSPGGWCGVAVLGRPGRHVHRHRGAPAGWAPADAQAAVGEPCAVPRCGGGRHPCAARDRRRRAVPGRASGGGADGHHRGDQRAAGAQGRAHAAGDHPRFRRRAANRLPESPAHLRPAHRAAGDAL